MRTPRPYTVFRPIAGRNFPEFLFVIHAYSPAQARALVAERVAGETLVLRVPKGGPLEADIYR